MGLREGREGEGERRVSALIFVFDIRLGFGLAGEVAVWVTLCICFVLSKTVFGESERVLCAER